MALLKEDGSLDIERINQLPILEWMDLMGELTDEQFEEYTSKSPINESVDNEVHYTTNEELDRRGYIKLSTVIKNTKKEFGFE
ncbi:MAG: hypothetical protein MJZ41_14115 [Bacteroidaceae bacterium]|nr:hypothetical protein [Bacteroidaceae bacterium]